MLEALELIMPPMIFILGAYMGSLSYVIILRWPVGQPFILSRSRCLHCDRQLTWYEIIPLLSWIFLGGRCRTCDYKISFSYFTIELFMALFFLTLYGFVGLQWRLIEYAFFLFGLVTITIIDLKHFLIPDILTLTGVVLGLMGAAINPERGFLDSFTGLLLGGGFFWFVSWIYFMLRREEGLGGGDIKLLAWIGAVLGWKSIPVVIFISSILGLFIGLLMLPLTQRGLRTVLPYGPFLAGASIFYIFGGDQWSLPYLKFLFPWLFH